MKKSLMIILILFDIIFVLCSLDMRNQVATRDDSNAAVSVVARTDLLPAVRYATSHWRWTKYDHSVGRYHIDGGRPISATEVPDDSSGIYYQPDFMCAEFVARALATLTNPNIFPDLYNNWDPSYYFAYKRGNVTYQLSNVGTSTVAGLYNFLINEGYGVDLRGSTTLARAGDVVFYYDGAPNYATGANRRHTALITSAARIPGIRVTGHNAACNSILYTNLKLTPSIVHLRNWVEFYPSYKVRAVAPATGSFSRNIATIYGNNSSCSLIFYMTGGGRYMVKFDYFLTGYGGGSFTSPGGSVSITSSNAASVAFEWKNGHCILTGNSAGCSMVSLANLHFYRMQLM